MSEMLKGVLDGMILEIISRGEIYGYAILKQLQLLGFEDIAEGTVYALLVRLEKNGMVHIEKRPSEMGPPRKFYSLNDRGKAQLESFWQRWDFLNESIRQLRNDEGGNYEL